MRKSAPSKCCYKWLVSRKTLVPNQKREFREQSRGISKHILTCQLRSNTLQDIRNHDADVTDTFGNTKPAVKQLLEKIKLRQVPV